MGIAAASRLLPKYDLWPPGYRLVNLLLKSDVLPFCSVTSAKKCSVAIVRRLQVASGQLAGAGFPPGRFGGLDHWR